MNLNPLQIQDSLQNASSSVELGQPEVSPLPIPEVGNFAFCTTTIPQGLVLLALLLIIGGFLWYSRQMSMINRMIGLVVIAGIFQFIHGIIGCTCDPSQLCKSFFLLNLLATGLAIGYLYYDTIKKR